MDWSALTSLSFNLRQIAIILGVAVIVVTGYRVVAARLRRAVLFLPRPSEITRSAGQQLPTVAPHLVVTLQELLIGYVIGASIGIVLAAVVTQSPLVEKIITPYILILVMTPMLALVPLLILKFGFGMTPRIIAVALAVGPMVMINSATGFRGRTAPSWPWPALRRLDAPDLHQSPLSAGAAHDHRRPDGRRHLRPDHRGRRRDGGRRPGPGHPTSPTTRRWRACPASLP